jgi:hypothetical protein
MAKIKKIQQIQKVKATKKNDHFVLQSKLFNKAKIDRNLSKHREVKVALSVDDMLRELRELKDIYKNGITLSNVFKYVDKARIHRAKTELKIFFLKTFSRKNEKDIFKFIAKSSGKNTKEYYQVEVSFRDIDAMIEENMTPKEILLNSTIATQCSCEDFTYRFRYYLTKMEAVLGLKEHRFPKITNAHREHKFLCKHQTLVLNGMRKNAFLATFTRYINNKKKGKGIRINKKDISSTYISSSKIKINEKTTK